MFLATATLISNKRCLILPLIYKIISLGRNNADCLSCAYWLFTYLSIVYTESQACIFAFFTSMYFLIFLVFSDFTFFFFLVWPIACLCVNFQIFMDFPVFLLPAYYRRRKRCRFNPWVRKIPWRRKWQPSPIFLPGKSHGQRSLAGFSPWGCKESDTTERLTQTHTLNNTLLHIWK